MSRNVVITGGTRGIGLGLAKEFLARGCTVTICGRDQVGVDKAVGALESPNVRGVRADVTRRQDVQALWDAAAERGTVDIWVNNAGASAPRRPIPEIAPEAVDTVVGANLVGSINGCAVAVAGMSAQGHGSVWNMDGFGSNGQMQPGMSVYGASKRAVNYLTGSLVKECKDTPVRMGFLSPGIVATDLLVGDYDGQPEAMEKARTIFNILGDRVETVTPWLVDGILAADKNGAKVVWLTKRKAFARFATAYRKRDIFSETVAP